MVLTNHGPKFDGQTWERAPKPILSLYHFLQPCIPPTPGSPRHSLVVSYSQTLQTTDMVHASVLREAALFYAECNLPEISQQKGFQDTMAGSLDFAQVRHPNGTTISLDSNHVCTADDSGTPLCCLCGVLSSGGSSSLVPGCTIRGIKHNSNLFLGLLLRLTAFDKTQ